MANTQLCEVKAAGKTLNISKLEFEKRVNEETGREYWSLTRGSYLRLLIALEDAGIAINQNTAAE